MLRKPHWPAAILLVAASGAGPALAEGDCPAERPAPVRPTDPSVCKELHDDVRRPASMSLKAYEEKLGRYLKHFCHRAKASGWVRDKRVRDTGPYTARLESNAWEGAYDGTHAPVVIWYSPQAAEWVKQNRGADDRDQARDDAPVPDGAMLIKEMYPAPAERCDHVAPERLMPTKGAAVMIRDPDGAQDGWFWGSYGWDGWRPDYPARNTDNGLPSMGFGQYCMNCHASARDNLTFASARNMQGTPGEPLVFLSQSAGLADSPESPHHRKVVLPDGDAPRLGSPHRGYDDAFRAAFPAPDGPAPDWDSVPEMPSQTYDNVAMPAGKPDSKGQYLTSSQCVGCHDAGATGLQYNMTAPAGHDDKLHNLSPYGTWRSSPMGLAGRDPVFFAQLASETQSFHPDKAETVANVCLGCHGILGQRQFGIDHNREKGDCGKFSRAMAEARGDDENAHYGALARDGISCMACHHMVLGDRSDKTADAPRNTCVEARQNLLNPDKEDFARTFTGSFMVGPADTLYGPFADPKKAPMRTALGITPEKSNTLDTSEACGTCHTVHLPVFHKGEVVGRIYEQTTYAEWAFSEYRTGDSAYGALPAGAGDNARSCQGCHMPSRDHQDDPFRSKIATIQEKRTFPQAEFAKPAEQIDLEPREPYARHTLVGLNLFLVKMAQQFPDVLGLRTTDPMMGRKGVDPLVRTEQAMLETVEQGDVATIDASAKKKNGTLKATVTVDNNVGHKFPSGVGFRRAFVTFEVLDQNGNVLWASGRTDPVGRLIDGNGDPIRGEVWWKKDCSARVAPKKRRHQPHYQVIDAQDEAQIYQELVSTPPEGKAPGKVQCGHDAAPKGRLTTSFLSICAEVKDNRLLPDGFLPRGKREAIARALGAGPELGQDVSPLGVDGDPRYEPGGSGGDSLTYRVDLDNVDGRVHAVRARLSFQATPPFFLQDRFCSARGKDRDRLYFLAGHLNLEGTRAANWALTVGDTGRVTIN